MKDANFEKELNNRLADYHSSMDLDAEWAALDARRTKKRKRPIAWIWWGSGIFVLGTLLSFYFANADHSSPNNDPKLIEDKIAHTITSSNEAIPKPNDIKSSNLTSDLASENQDVKIAERSTPEGDAVNAKKTIPNDLLLSGSGSKSSAILNKKENQPKRILSESRLMQVENFQNQESQRQVSKQIKVPFSESEKVQAMLDEKQAFSISSTDPTFDELSFLPLKSPVLKLPKVDFDLEFHTNTRFKFMPVVPARWTVGLFTGYGKTFRNLEAVDNDLAPLIARRNDSETALDEWHAKLQIRRLFKHNWFAGIGIELAHATDRFIDVEESITLELRENQLTSLTYKSDGTLDSTYGSALVEVKTIKTSEFYQYHQSLALQLIGGRNFSFNNHFGTAVSTGLTYSLWSSKKGTVYSNEATRLFVDLADSEFSKHGVVNALISAEFYYRSNQNWEFSLGLTGQSNLTNAFGKTSGIVEKRQVVGLELGFRKSL